MESQVMGDAASTFGANGYVLVRGLLNIEIRSIVWDHIKVMLKEGLLKPDPQSGLGMTADTRYEYGDPVTDRVLLIAQQRIQEVTGLDLLPTYSLYRVYRCGDSLLKHTDRHACEISASVTIAFDSSVPWPFWIKGPTGPAPLSLQPGDGVVYKGIELPHWREPFTGRYAAQLFLHYVNRKGAYSHLIFDRRPSLACV